MTECPGIDELEQALASADADVASHVRGCGACHAVVDILRERRSSGAPPTCVQAELWLAAREAEALAGEDEARLDRHLASCAACRELAAAGDGESFAQLAAVERDRYAFGDELGRGGMGRIMAAMDRRLGRPVAVKELLGRDGPLEARFRREALVTARLQHPAIVPVYEAGRWPSGEPFYVMKQVSGRSLHEVIAATGSDAERIALVPTVLAVAEAVAYAHSERIIHRDLKPANILVGAFGETVVIDWGLAKDLADTSADAGEAGPYRTEASALTVAGAVVGTPAYMPPEQARAETVDERTDVYALGAILYHVLSGEPPYGRASSEAVLAQVVEGPPAPIRERAPGAPHDVVAIVDKAMARRAADRYRTAGELANDLRRFQTGQLVGAHVYSAGELVRRWARRNRRPVAVAVVLLAALTATAIVSVRGIVRARDRAETQRRAAEAQGRIADTQRAAAQQASLMMLEERGRQELLAGNLGQAAVLLSEAYAAGDPSPALRVMLAEAMRPLDALERTLDCGGELEGIPVRPKVSWVEVDPAGTRLLAGCNYLVKSWTLADGAPIFSVPSDGADLEGARYSHDGTRFVVWGGEGRVAVLDAATGRTLAALVGHAGRVTGAHFTPDDRRVVTTAFDGTARVWDGATGAELRVIRAARPPHRGVRGQLLADGGILLTFTADGKARLWDIDTGALGRSIDPGTRFIDPQVSRRGTLATCGTDGAVKLWSVDSGRLERSLPAHSALIWTCAFSPDGRRLLTTSADGTGKIWDVDAGALVASLAQGGGLASHGAFSPDGRAVVTTSTGVPRLWDAATGDLIAVFGGGAVGDARFSPDGSRLISSEGSRVRIWKRADVDPLAAFDPPAGMAIAHSTSDGTRVLLKRADGTLELVDAGSGRALPAGPLRPPALVSLDDSRIAATRDGEVVLVDPATGAAIASVPVGNPPRGLGLSRDARRLYIDADDGSRVWDVDRRAELLALPAGSAILGNTDDGKRLLARDPAGLAVWEVDGGRRLATLDSFFEEVNVVGFSADGTRVVLAEGGGPGDRRVGLWDVATGKRAFSIPGSFWASLDPAGRLLVTFSVDGVRIWRIADATLISSFLPASSTWNGVLDPEGTLLAGWDMSGASVIASAEDGRVLITHPISLDIQLTEDTFTASASALAWAKDGGSYLYASTAMRRWPVGREARPPDQIRAIVRDRVPWRLVDGRLVGISGRLTGTVTRRGRPVAGATINLSRWPENDLQFGAASHPDGAYDFDAVPPGTYQIEAHDPEAATRWQKVEIAEGESTLDLDLEHSSAITGVVVDPRGHPVFLAFVGVSCCGGARPGEQGMASGAAFGESMTAPDGTFAIRGITEIGEYEITVRRGGSRADYQPADGAFPKVRFEGGAHRPSVRLVVVRGPP